MSEQAKLERLVAEQSAQLAMATQQAVVDRAMDVCIKRCVSSKDARLTESQKACLTGCTMAFMEGFGLAADTMQALLKKEAGSR